MAKGFKYIIRICAYIICTAVWFVVGLFVWIPLLVRVTTIYCAKLIYNTTVENSEEDTVRMEQPFERVIDFWFLGFRTVYKTFFAPEEAGVFSSDSEFKFLRFIGEIIWILIFYILMDLFFFGKNIPKLYEMYFSNSSNTKNSANQNPGLTHEQLNSLETTYTLRIDSMRQLYEHKIDSIITMTGNNNKLPIDSATKTTTYFVDADDTLYRIAKRFGVTVEQLKEWNNLVNDNIRVGQKLIVLK